MAAAAGARGAVVEVDRLGGTCVNVGCVPKKLFVYASEVGREMHDARRLGWTATGLEFDWPTLRDNKTAEIERLNGVYRRLLEDASVEILRGRGSLVDRHTVRIEGAEVSREVSAAKILIAVGGWPNLPSEPGVEHAITSNEMFYLPELPRHAVVAGGGYIAVEFAGILHGLGVDTTLVYRRDLFLRGFDRDVREALRDEMRRQGIRLVFGEIIEEIRETPGGECRLEARLSGGDRLATDLVLYAIGRTPNTRGLGLENAGVELGENGAICVDEYGRTSVDNIFAIGDVTDRVNLTPVALHEAMCLVRTLFHDDPIPFDHELVASAVFSHPPIGAVGLTEEEARKVCGDDSVEIYRSHFKPLKHTLTENEGRSLMKLVVDKASRRVVGAHMLGADAGEIMQGLAIAMKMGATKEDFDRTIGIHPTSAEEFVTMRTPVGG